MTSTVYIAKNVYGGDGLGRLGDGRVVFVPGAWAGEQVKAEITEEKRHFVKARLVEVVEASPDRLGTEAPPIPGMVYSALAYPAELKTKAAQLTEFLERARLSAPAVEILKVPQEPRNYRNKVVYHFAKQDGRWALGYRLEPSHRILEVADDPLARPEINAALPEIRSAVMRLLTQGAAAVRRSIEEKGNVTIRWSERSGVKWWLGSAPKDTVLKETTCGRVFEVPADGFYQVNPVAGGVLAETVADEYRRGRAEAGEFLDLYCGVGVFGLVAKPEKLLGVESGRQAIEFARRNAERQGVKAEFLAAQVAQVKKRLRPGPRTTVVVDPPRGGLEPGVAPWLARSEAARIFYVSCDPATLTRDLKTLASAYDVKAVRMIDMFPRTARFETFVVLAKR